MWFVEGRVTEDLDLFGLAGTQTQRLALMELALEAGLPVEAVNSTADFFVRRIAGWRLPGADRALPPHRRRDRQRGCPRRARSASAHGGRTSFGPPPGAR